MDSKILTPEEAIKISKQIQSRGQKIILAGGCFDILHIGHITFLQKAKEQGDILFVFLESDAVIKKIKGENRPINTQKDRGQILAHLSMVDYVVMLPEITDNNTYDNLVINIKPAIIATTAGDINLSHKKRQAQKIGAKVVEVTNQISNNSTTKLIKIFNEI